MLRIGPFSKLGKTTVKTLRHYDEAGLLKPAFIDAATGYRYYTAGQLLVLHEIVALRQMGFSLGEISAIQGGRRVEEILHSRRRELAAQLNTLSDSLFRLEHYIQNRKEGKLMDYNAALKELPACTVYSYRTTLPNYAAIYGVMEEIRQKLARTNPALRMAQPPYCFNMYLDGEYREADIAVELCTAVEQKGKDGEGIVFKTLPAITVASVLHRGRYDDLGAAYAFVLGWMETNGYEPAGHPRESYIEGAWSGKAPEEWLTEIQVPVQKSTG